METQIPERMVSQCCHTEGQELDRLRSWREVVIKMMTCQDGQLLPYHPDLRQKTGSLKQRPCGLPLPPARHLLMDWPNKFKTCLHNSCGPIGNPV